MTTTETNQRVMYTVSCVDALFGQRVNDGSYLTLDEALAGVAATRRRLATTARAFRVHLNPLGMGRIDSQDVVLSVLEPLAGGAR